MTTYKGIKGFTAQTLSSDPTTASSVGQIYYNSTSNVFKYVQPGGGAWSSGGALNTATSDTGGAGIQTAALATGGNPGAKTKTEIYDGSSWTEVGDLNLGRYGLVADGTTTASVAFGGALANNTNKNETEIWNGTAWTEVNNLNTARRLLNGAGISTSALAFGGRTPGGASVATEEWTVANAVKTVDLS